MRTLRSLVAAVLTVVMIACLSVSAFAAYEEITYEDVSEMYGTTLSGVNTVYIKFADKLGIVPSMTDGSFNPSGVISRIDALKMAYRMLHYDYDELTEYSSVKIDFDESNGGDITDVYTMRSYIAWAMDYQLINSQYVPDNKFEPHRPITGEEFITLMAKVLSIADETSTAEDYESALEIVLMDAEVSVSSETINREQAAVVAARAMLFDPVYGDVNEDMYTNFNDYELNCLATNVYGCANTQLIVRATRQRPMDYEGVISDVLFSNGVQMDIGADLSSFVGYQMDLVFMDKDGSGTFTQDEEIITYQMVSPMVTTTNLSLMKIDSYSALRGTTKLGSPVKVQTNSLLYLNDRLWPADQIYNLIELVSFIEVQPGVSGRGDATAITNRPNMEFTFIQHSDSETANVVLATEWIPGKIMTVTNDYISVYSYYDNKTYVFEDNYISMSKLANPSSGDHVNFYIAGDRMYLTQGTTARMESYELISDQTNGEMLSVKDTGTYMKHLFYNSNSVSVSDLNGRPAIAVLDSSKTTYIALEEPIKGKELAVKIKSATASSGVYANVVVEYPDSGETKNLKVEIAKIFSSTGVMREGDVYTCFETEGGAIYMYGIDPVTMDVIETEDYFITPGGKKYLKTEDYVSQSDTLLSGKAVLTIDRYNGVRAAKAA